MSPVAYDVVDLVADLQHGGDERQDRDVAVRAGRQGNRRAVIDEIVGDQGRGSCPVAPGFMASISSGDKRLRWGVHTPSTGERPDAFSRFQRPVFDQVADAAGAEAFPERPHGIADDRRIGACPHRRRARQVEQRADLAEVVAARWRPSAIPRRRRPIRARSRARPRTRHRCSRPSCPARTAPRPPSARTVSGGRSDRREVRHQFDDAIGQRQNPAVVGRDDHHPVTGREFADQPQHLLDLDEVQVRGRLVGEDQAADRARSPARPRRAAAARR